MNESIRYGRKRSGIKKQLHEKITEWIKSIDDSSVRELVSKNTIVTGGSIASMLLGEKINDYDVYMRDKVTTLAVANYYVKKFNDNRKIEVGEGVEACIPFVKEEVITNNKGNTEDVVGIYIKSAGVAAESQKVYEYFEGKPESAAQDFAESLGEKKVGNELYRPIFLSQNAITLNGDIQIVIRFYGEPDKIFENYDFQHAMSYFDYNLNALVCPPEALECLLSRTLIYKGSLFPIATLMRVRKFLDRGWRISAGQLLKIAFQISELDLTDKETVRQQLTGVDAAYFHQLLSAIEDTDPEKMNSAYISVIIDKIFSEEYDG